MCLFAQFKANGESLEVTEREFLYLTPHASRLTLFFLLFLWATSLTNLDRFPKIHEDEAWQAAPGYTFWAEGRFATDLFAGFYGMEQHYYGFMPLFPILVGGTLHLFGLGLFQARLVPLTLTLLTLALTYRLGAKLFSPWHGLLAIVILTTWRIAGPFAHLVSGIPLADVARIARYDSAVPVFGLGALLLFVHSFNLDRLQIKLTIVNHQLPITNYQLSIVNGFFIGALAGLATLSHVYGAFWLPALLLALLWVKGQQAVKPATAILIGFGLMLLPWLLFVASGWSDFMAQNRNYADRFGLLDVRFYLVNLLNEVERYDPILNGAKQSLGAWVWLIAGALSLIWLLKHSLSRSQFRSISHIAWVSGVQTQFGHPILLRNSVSQQNQPISARILLTPIIVLGSLFTLLLSFKTFSYLATLWPLFALAIAAGGWHGWQAQTTRRWWRPLLLLIVLTTTSEGVLSQLWLHHIAQAFTPYQRFTQTIAAQAPPGSRILGLQHYWLGLAETDPNYHSILTPIFFTDSRYVPHPLTFTEAVELRPPQVVLLDQIMLNFLAETESPQHPHHQLGQDIWNYLNMRQARLIGQIDDPTYGRVEIYRLR
jgi:hypothetical protein